MSDLLANPFAIFFLAYFLVIAGMSWLLAYYSEHHCDHWHDGSLCCWCGRWRGEHSEWRGE